MKNILFFAVFIALASSLSARDTTRLSQDRKSPGYNAVAERTMLEFDANFDEELDFEELERSLDFLMQKRTDRSVKLQKAKAGGELDVQIVLTPLSSDVAGSLLDEFDYDGTGRLSIDELARSYTAIRKYNLNTPLAF